MKNLLTGEFRGFVIMNSCGGFVCVYQDGRVVKALDLRSNGHMSAWVRTPLLVTDIYVLYRYVLTSPRYCVQTQKRCCSLRRSLPVILKETSESAYETRRANRCVAVTTSRLFIYLFILIFSGE